MTPLTAKQQKLLDYLRSCEGCPSFAEMRDALGCSSKSSIHRLVSRLEERGYIRRLRERARAIELVDMPSIPKGLTRFTDRQLAQAAERRGLVLGRIYNIDGQPTFYEIDA